MAFYKTNAAAAAELNTNSNSGVKSKQKPVKAVRTSNGGSRKQPFKRENNKKPVKIDVHHLMDKPGPVLDVKAHFNRDTEILLGYGENMQELQYIFSILRNFR